jgi:hypothetical protein
MSERGRGREHAGESGESDAVRLDRTSTLVDQVGLTSGTRGKTVI